MRVFPKLPVSTFLELRLEPGIWKAMENVIELCFSEVPILENWAWGILLRYTVVVWKSNLVLTSISPILWAWDSLFLWHLLPKPQKTLEGVGIWQLWIGSWQSKPLLSLSWVVWGRSHSPLPVCLLHIEPLQLALMSEEASLGLVFPSDPPFTQSKEAESSGSKSAGSSKVYSSTANRVWTCYSV